MSWGYSSICRAAFLQEFLLFLQRKQIYPYSLKGIAGKQNKLMKYIYIFKSHQAPRLLTEYQPPVVSQKTRKKKPSHAERKGVTFYYGRGQRKTCLSNSAPPLPHTEETFSLYTFPRSSVSQICNETVPEGLHAGEGP